MSTPAPADPPVQPGAAGGGPGVTASLARRALAIIIDWVAALLLARLFSSAPYGSSDYALMVLIIFAGEIIVLTWLTGSSFGQRIMGIAVVAETGGRLALWRIIVRTVLICLVVPALVYDSQRRGLQDLAVGSRVVMRTSVGMSR